MENINQPPKVLKWALIIGIVIVLNLFVNYALSLVFIEPQFDQFCGGKDFSTTVVNQNDCTNAGGEWTPYVDGRPIEVKPSVMVDGYCKLIPLILSTMMTVAMRM